MRRGLPSQRMDQGSVDAIALLDDVREFVELARSGAYFAGDRRVSPRERTRWRFTFQRLAEDAQGALRNTDAEEATAALEALVDLACELRQYDHFRSADPVEAARFVVSDAVAMLWSAQRDRHGFATFAERAAPQLIRWESEFGWTRTGFGRVAERETTLASVLERMLPAQDMWETFVDRYLDALDTAADRPRRRSDRDERERTAHLAEWHLLVVDRLIGSEVEDRLDRLVEHPALGGPDLWFLQAHVARHRGDIDSARRLVHRSLEKLPGHDGFLGFAHEIGVPLPDRARRR